MGHRDGMTIVLALSGTPLHEENDGLNTAPALSGTPLQAENDGLNTAPTLRGSVGNAVHRTKLFVIK